MSAGGKRHRARADPCVGLHRWMELLCLTGAVVISGCGDDSSSPSQASSSSIAETIVKQSQENRFSEVRDLVSSTPPLPPAPKPSETLPPDVSCVTPQCHATFTTARYVHGIVSSGDCSVCHESDEGAHTFPLRLPGNEGCKFCHPVADNRLHQHAAIQEQGCITCHKPHVSDTKFLLTGGSVREVCIKCHVVDHGRNMHGPFADGQCTACHEPHESNYTDLLKAGDGPDHCAMCHGEKVYAIASAAYVHAPAAEACIVCHDSHASDQAYLLYEAIDETCFTCHLDIEKGIAGATAPHAAVFTGSDCANCHDPHASGRPKLLRDRQDKLCLQCHDQATETADGRIIESIIPMLSNHDYLHGPVEAHNCTACHNVHGSSLARLLRNRFSEEFYATFDLSNFELCFNCHDAELVTAPRTTTATDFRSGDVNLHFVHVNRQEKGRTCRTCHAIHASDNPKLLADSVAFDDSSWPLPIGFKKTVIGGSCAPGCHEPLGYSRDVTIIPPDRSSGEGGP